MKTSSLIANFKRNIKPPFWKKVAWGALGAASYAVVPTALKGWAKLDTDGWLGMALGISVPSAIGLAFNKPEVAYGAFSAAGCHLLYVKGNNAVAQVFGTPIFSFGGTAVTMSDYYNQIGGSSDPYGALADEIPPGMQEITLPDGTKVLGSATPSNLNDYYEQLPAPQSVGMNDYYSAIPTQANGMSDYLPSLEPVNALNDGITNDYLNTLAFGY